MSEKELETIEAEAEALEEVEDIEAEDQEDSEADAEDQEADAEEEAEADSEDDSEDNEPRIPKARFDEVIAQREAERERVAKLEETVSKLLEKMDAMLTPQEEEEIEEEINYDFDLAEKKYIELISEGEYDLATKLRKEIDDNRTALLQRQIEEARKKTISESKAAIEEEKFNTVRETLESQYKIFQPESEVYNEEAVELVNNLMVGYMANGKTKAVALKMAVDKAVKIYEPKPVVSKRRDTEAKKKNLKAMKKQPPKMSQGKTPKDLEIDISKLDRETFKKLSKEEKARLRGDIL